MNIKVEQVMTRTKLRLGLMDSTMADAYLEKLIDEAARHLDALSTYVVTCETLDIVCSKAELPENIRSNKDVICMRFNEGNSGCSCQTSTSDGDTIENINNSFCGCGYWYVPDRNVLTNFCGQGANAQWCGNIFDINGGYIQFPTTLTATQVTIWYRAYNMDDGGLMIVNEKQERALSAYAAYEYAMSGQNIKSYTPYQISNWQKTWVAQKNWLRGSDVVDDHKLHKAEFSAIARAILLNPQIAMDRNV
jgi:hypothetical protein